MIVLNTQSEKMLSKMTKMTMGSSQAMKRKHHSNKVFKKSQRWFHLSFNLETSSYLTYLFPASNGGSFNREVSGFAVLHTW